MKKVILLSFLLFLSSGISAQTSDKGFSFQGYAIDPDGKALALTAVTVKFTLSPGSFTEEHQVTTDGFGVFHAIIGNSSLAKKAEFEKLDFTAKSTDYALKVEVKKTAGGTYTTISNEPMLAVPYARKAENGVPVGTIVAYAGNDVNKIPEGWKLCDGASVLKTDYPQLYAILGDAWGTSGSSFNLPDLRGRFLRGVDDGEGNDPDAASRTAIKTGGNTGDAVGSVQDDQFGEHNHPGSTSTDGNHRHSKSSNDQTSDDGDGAVGLENADGDPSNHTAYTSFNGDHNHTVTTQNRGGSETRPVNAAVYYIIKY